MSIVNARHALVAILLVVVGGAIAAPGLARQEPDDDEAAYREAIAHRSLQENCLICHTEDVIASQRLTPAQWQGEVDKMIRWGSPLPKEAAGPLVEYLSRRYSDHEPTPEPSRSKLVEVDSYEIIRDHVAAIEGADLERGEKLYVANCATCHGPTALGGDLGPSLVAKTILDHRRVYDRIINDGLRRMPGFKLTMNAKEQADVLAWLRRQTYPERQLPRETPQ